MRFPSPLVPGTLVKRYKRFLADVTLETGETITAHCPNPGAMTGLDHPGEPVWLSKSPNPKRKLAYTLEIVQPPEGGLVGINTQHPNAIVEEAIRAGTVPELDGCATLRREVKYGANCRIDILLEDADGRATYVEVKNVHLMRQPGLAEFPDSVTKRGAKHLGELADMVEAGHRAVMVYLVQRSDCDCFALAADIDPGYAAAFEAATARGVEAVILACSVTFEGVDVAGVIAN
ncbi:MAG: DNA/RNA nuclease SfsA [Rhodobiaceae bacterium]|nr:DNA/RNA nuclease SfsA [Rhodobiaceae bacterium]